MKMMKDESKKQKAKWGKTEQEDKQKREKKFWERNLQDQTEQYKIESKFHSTFRTKQVSEA